MRHDSNLVRRLDCGPVLLSDGAVMFMTTLWDWNAFQITGTLWGQPVDHLWIFVVNLNKLLNASVFWYSMTPTSMLFFFYENIFITSAKGLSHVKDITTCMIDEARHESLMCDLSQGRRKTSNKQCIINDWYNTIYMISDIHIKCVVNSMHPSFCHGLTVMLCASEARKGH